MVPPDVLLISESGVASHADVQRLAPIADAFLVGSSLMASDDIAEAARALVHGRTKLCGLTRIEDVELAARSGATHIGLVLVPGTPRAIEPGLARELATTAHAFGMKAVGVFRNEGPQVLARTAETIGVDAVQVHGQESDAAIAEIKRRLPDADVWAACSVDDGADAPRRGADRQLFDTRRNGEFGGTGSVFDWTVLTDRSELPYAFLAGGIGPDNAAAAARIGAYGLDVGSRIEAAPGRKDAAKVEALFAALRPTARCGR
jgi:indole-3-glycerol phosphate synthase/phosphoribosylanthranilate isomerase